MSIKTLGRSITARMGRQILAVQTHSPTILMGAGAVGVTASVILACRATLKLSDVLEVSKEKLEKVTNGESVDDSGDKLADDEIKASKFGVQLQTAIDIAKLYAPATIIGVSSLAMITSSHLILKRRNAGLIAVYGALDQSYRNYRKRVVADQGEEKDFEYFHGVEEREQVEETKDGPVVKTVKGLDQEALKNADPEKIYSRVFCAPTRDSNGEPIPGTGNKHWSDIPNQNQIILQMFQSQLNDLLRMQGHVFLNQAYDLLGYEPTAAGQVVGWKKNPEEGDGDNYISFGVWHEGVYKGTQWLNGDTDSILLDFNVDGPILGALKKL